MIIFLQENPIEFHYCAKYYKEYLTRDASVRIKFGIRSCEYTNYLIYEALKPESNNTETLAQ